MSVTDDPKKLALKGIGDMVQPSLDALMDCVKGENVKDKTKARNHQTRMLAAKYVLDVVLDRMPAAESGTGEQEQAKRLTPEQAVDELRRRLTVAK